MSIVNKTFFIHNIYSILKKIKCLNTLFLLYKINYFLLRLISNPLHLEFQVRASNTITLLLTGSATVETVSSFFATLKVNANSDTNTILKIATNLFLLTIIIKKLPINNLYYLMRVFYFLELNSSYTIFNISLIDIVFSIFEFTNYIKHYSY